jgi:hypothetical protein
MAADLNCRRFPRHSAQCDSTKFIAASDEEQVKRIPASSVSGRWLDFTPLNQSLRETVAEISRISFGNFRRVTRQLNLNGWGIAQK